MLLGCHVNVEFCANLLGSIKYIHKYISKGPDHATIIISPDGAADEIHHYQDCHYISPPEAVWHIFQFSLHGCTPNVYRLQLHLQGENQVFFDPDQALPDAVQQAANRRSMLDGFYIVSALLCKFHATLNSFFSRQTGNMTLQRRFSTRISLHTSPGNLKRWCGLHGKRGMLLVESTIVVPELGIASTFVSFSHTSRALNQSNIYALSMEFSMQLAKLHLSICLWVVCSGGGESDIEECS